MLQVRDFKFMCPDDTVFDQENFICANWFEIDCRSSTLFYDKNLQLFQKPDEWSKNNATNSTSTEEPTELERRQQEKQVQQLHILEEQQQQQVFKQQQLLEQHERRQQEHQRNQLRIIQDQQKKLESQQVRPESTLYRSNSPNFRHNSTRSNGKQITPFDSSSPKPVHTSMVASTFQKGII